MMPLIQHRDTHYPTLLLPILDSYYPRTNKHRRGREILSDLVTIRFKKPQGGKQNLTCIAIKEPIPHGCFQGKRD